MHRDDPERPRSSLTVRQRERERERGRGRATLHSQSSLRTLYARSDPYKCNHDGEVAADEASMRRGVACARETTALDWSCAFFQASTWREIQSRINVDTTWTPAVRRCTGCPIIRAETHQRGRVCVRCDPDVCTRSTPILPATRGWDF